MKHAAVVLGVIVSLLAGAREASAKWTRVTSPHFLFVGDASEREIRSIAERLERFRTVVSRIFYSEVVDSPSPTVVVVFQNDRSFTPFKPVFQGKPVSVAGVFTGGEDLNYISVNAEQDGEAYNVIFHEYMHYLLRNAYGEMPAWFNEGVAQVYQSFSMSGSDVAILGSPDALVLELLQKTRTWVPTSEMIAVTNESARYNEGDARTLFYAQSWALAHYLTFGPRGRNGQMASFLAALKEGVDGRDAFIASFGSDLGVLDRELRAYVHGLTFNSLRLELRRGVEAAAVSAGTTIADDEAEGYLGDLLARLNRDEEARTYLRTVINRNPRAVRALIAIGTLEVRAGNDVAAVPYLERAAALAPDDPSAQRAYGRALARYARRGNADSTEAWTRARQALVRASQLNPTDISILVTLAEVEMATDDEPERAVALMQRAVTASPGREEYRLMLAQAIGMAGDFETSKAQFRQFAARGSTGEIRDAAAKALARVERAQRIFEERFGAAPLTAPPERRGDSAASNAFTPSGDSARESAGGASAADVTSLRQAMRTVRASERRVFGTLASVQCSAGGAVIRVDTADESFEMAARALTNLEVISYRSDLPSSLRCESSPKVSVFATFVEEAVQVGGLESDYRATAIEFLPPGFEPR